MDELDRWIPVSVLGTGAFGQVHLAWDPVDRRWVALKRFTGQDELGLLRFVVESRIRVDHPHLVRSLAFRLVDDDALLVTELARGGSLRQLMTRAGPLPAHWVATVIGQVLDALAALHAHGVVHRDLKPANLLLRDPGAAPPHVLVADFGIATWRTVSLTGVGAAIGTPGYLAPEYLDQSAPSPRSDLFAVGVVAAELLAGRRLIHQSSASPEIRADWAVQVPLPDALPARFAAVLRRMADPNPDARYLDCTEAAEALRHAMPTEVPATVPGVDLLDGLPAGWSSTGPTSDAPAPAPVRTGPLTPTAPPPSPPSGPLPVAWPAPQPAAPSGPQRAAWPTPPPGASPEPEPAAPSGPGPAASSEPQPAAPSGPQPAASSEPQPVASSRPQPAAWPTPQPGASPEPEPAAPSGPGPAASSEPQPAAPSGPRPADSSEPQPVASSAPHPAAWPTPQPGAASGPQPTTSSGPQPAASPGPQPTAPSGPQPVTPSGPHPAAWPAPQHASPGPHPAASPMPQPADSPGPQPTAPSGPQPVTPSGPHPAGLHLAAPSEPQPAASSGTPSTAWPAPQPGASSAPQPAAWPTPQPAGSSGPLPVSTPAPQSAASSGPLSISSPAPRPADSSGPRPTGSSAPSWASSEAEAAPRRKRRLVPVLVVLAVVVVLAAGGIYWVTRDRSVPGGPVLPTGPGRSRAPQAAWTPEPVAPCALAERGATRTIDGRVTRCQRTAKDEQQWVAEPSGGFPVSNPAGPFPGEACGTAPDRDYSPTGVPVHCANRKWAADS